jgi:hypothetical protein
MLPNWASGPQNQPRANVAVSVLVGAMVSMGGIGRSIGFGPSSVTVAVSLPAKRWGRNIRIPKGARVNISLFIAGLSPLSVMVVSGSQ